MNFFRLPSYFEVYYVLKQRSGRNSPEFSDLLIRHKQSEQSFLAPKPQTPPPKGLYSDNPVMQEAMKYISPENWANMDTLIRDFDLELVEVTRITP